MKPALLSSFAPIVLGLAMALGCGEPAQPPTVATDATTDPPTNREIYEAARPEPSERAPDEEQRAIRTIRQVWDEHKSVFRSRFLGVPTHQNPLDAWVVQEIISEVKPDLIVEAGTFKGGSAAMWAMLLEHVNPEGRVVTIDIEDRRTERAKQLPLVQRKVEFLLGSSTDPAIVAKVRERAQGKRVLVILDSLHTAEHVAGELEAYAPLVPVGSYVIVQDTPVGPLEAVEAFVAANPGWEIDRSRERFQITNTVKGYLRRTR